MKFYRLNLSTDVEYEAARALVDGALGYSGDLTCISPYATAPVDQKGRVLLSLTDNQPGYLSLVYQFGLLVTAKKAKELTQDEYDQSFAPAPTGSGGGVSSWNDLTDRPFTSLGSGVTVVSRALTVPTYDRRSDTVSSVSYIGRAHGIGNQCQRVEHQEDHDRRQRNRVVVAHRNQREVGRQTHRHLLLTRIIMDATLPVQTDDGTTFPTWNISLAVSQALQPDGSQPVSIALRCVPARVTGNDDAPVETLDGRAVSVYRGRAEEITDPREMEAFAAVHAAVVAFLHEGTVSNGNVLRPNIRRQRHDGGDVELRAWRRRNSLFGDSSIWLDLRDHG